MVRGDIVRCRAVLCSAARQWVTRGDSCGARKHRAKSWASEECCRPRACFKGGHSDVVGRAGRRRSKLNSEMSHSTGPFKTQWSEKQSLVKLRSTNEVRVCERVCDSMLDGMLDGMLDCMYNGMAEWHAE